MIPRHLTTGLPVGKTLHWQLSVLTKRVRVNQNLNALKICRETLWLWYVPPEGSSINEMAILLKGCNLQWLTSCPQDSLPTVYHESGLSLSSYLRGVPRQETRLVGLTKCSEYGYFNLWRWESVGYVKQLSWHFQCAYGILWSWSKKLCCS